MSSTDRRRSASTGEARDNPGFLIATQIRFRGESSSPTCTGELLSPRNLICVAIRKPGLSLASPVEALRLRSVELIEAGHHARVPSQDLLGAWLLREDRRIAEGAHVINLLLDE